MTIRRSAAVSTTLLALAVAAVTVLAQPASAACHVAAFVQDTASGGESDGTVSLAVELQGRVDSCAGTVDVATEDGSATAGEDYEAVTRTLTFEQGDDRVETVDIVLLSDDEAEGEEDFTVVLSDPTGGISQTGGPATVTISDAGGGGDDDRTTSATASPDQPAPTTGDAAGAGGDDAATDEDDDGGVPIAVLVVVVLFVLAGGVFLAVRARA